MRKAGTGATGSRSRLGGNFHLLLAGNGVSVLGSSVYLLVIVLHLKQTTGSAAVLGLYNFIALLPPVILGPFAGALIDRWSLKQVLVLSDAARGLFMIILAGLAILPGGIGIVPLLLLTALAGICHAFFMPAVQSIIPEIEPPYLLKRANSARAAVSQLSNVAGNALGGLLYSLFGLVPILLANGMSFILSAIQESFIQIPPRAKKVPRKTILTETLEGFGYLRQKKGLGTLVLANAMVFLFSPPLMLALPFVIEDTLGLPTPMVGVAFAIMLGGGIGAYLLWGTMSLSRLADYRILTGSFFLLSVAVFLSGMFLRPVVLLGTLFFAGGAIASIHLMISTTVQRTVESHKRARVFALVEAAGALSAPFAYLASGFLVDLVLQEVTLVFLVSSAFIAMAGTLAIRSSGLRQLFDHGSQE